MSIYDDLSYTYPREIIIALIISAIVFWFGLRMTRKSERRFMRTRAAALEHKTITTDERESVDDSEKVLSAASAESER
jgi:uncharacterized membrane protein